jgi:hypothetical protein
MQGPKPRPTHDALFRLPPALLNMGRSYLFHYGCYLLWLYCIAAWKVRDRHIRHILHDGAGGACFVLRIEAS